MLQFDIAQIVDVGSVREPLELSIIMQECNKSPLKENSKKRNSTLLIHIVKSNILRRCKFGI